MSKTTLTIAGKEFTLSPVPLAGMEKLMQALDGEPSVADTFKVLIDSVYFGVKRNHPEVEREFFEWNIDATNVAHILKAVSEVNKAAISLKATVRSKK